MDEAEKLKKEIEDLKSKLESLEDERDKLAQMVGDENDDDEDDEGNEDEEDEDQEEDPADDATDSAPYHPPCCSFCGRTQDEVKKLIAGPSVYICDECVDLCNEILDEELFEKETNN